MLNIFLIIFIILLIVLFIVYRNINLVEGYDKWELKIFNQNWNKPWKDVEVGYNNPYPQDIPRSSNNDPNFPNYILEIVKEYSLKEVLSNMLEPQFRINNMRPIDLSWDNLFFLNKHTWYNDINELTVDKLQIKTPKSCLIQVNEVLKDFIKEFNRRFNKLKSEKYVREFYGNHPFKIYKFKLHHISQLLLNNNNNNNNNNHNCIYKYGLIVVLLREEGYYGITLYLEYIVVGNDYHLVKYDLIGYYTTDKLFLPDGVREVGKKKYYEINPLYRLTKNDKTLNEYVNDKNWNYLTPTYYNVDKILWKQKQYALNNTLHNQHTCFNTEPEYYNPSNTPPTMPESNNPIVMTYVYNKYNCESKYDMYGRRKPKGKWDRPCLTDKECSYYGKNKNYKNKFGKCDKETGFCQFPVGMKNMSFHKYFPYNLTEKDFQDRTIPVSLYNKNQLKKQPEPRCYNCLSVNQTNEWQPITPLDTCCQEQKDKDKYPHLNGPDYAFYGDKSTRLNYYRSNK